MNRYQKRGFTLVELLATLAIIAILFVLAFPAYTAKVKKSYRLSAQGDLIAFAAAFEQFFVQHLTYMGAGSKGDNNALGEPSIFSSVSPSGGNATPRYSLTIINATQFGYVLQATPFDAQHDDGRITLDSQGKRCWYKGFDISGGDCIVW